MNEQANIEVIRRTYAAFNAADLAAILSHIVSADIKHPQYCRF